MTESLFGPEMKPWEDPKDERLSPSSYGAVAIFGVTQMAVKQVREDGDDLTPAAVGFYAQLFARIVIKAQVELGHANGAGGWASSLNTRLRGALHTALEVVGPVKRYDLDATQDPMRDWEDELYGLVISIAKTAAWLHSRTAEQIMAAGK